MMKLSIIIPAYNAEMTVSKCIDSVYMCNAKPSEFECIVINDGSTDNTENILHKYCEKYNNFSFYTIKNSGVSYARNLGIEYAKGDFLSFIDSDDLFIEKAIDTILNAIENHCEDLVIFNYIEQRGRKKVLISIFEDEIHRLDYKNRVKSLVFDNMNLNSCWGKVFKRNIITENGIEFPPSVRIGEDSIFVLKYLRCAKSLFAENTPIIIYRLWSGNTMSSYSIDRFENYCEDAKVRFELFEDMFSGNSSNSICFQYIRLYFYFFISYACKNNIFNIQKTRTDIENSEFYSLILSKLNFEKINLSQKTRLLFFVNNSIFVNIIYKLLSYIKRAVNILR